MARPILHLVLVFCLITSWFPAMAQGTDADSLLLALNGKTGKDRLSLLNQLGTALRESDQKSAFDFSKEADSLAVQLDDLSARSRALENIGWIYYRQGQWQKSFEYSSEAYHLSLKAEDKLQAARLMNNMGALYYEQTNYPKAIEQFKNGYRLATEVNDLATRIRSLNNVALNFSQIGQQDSALAYAKRSLQLNEDAGSPYLTSFAHRVIGDVYLSKGNYDTAQAIYNQSLQLARAQGIKSFEAGVLHRLGNAYLLNGDLKEAKEILTYSIELCEENGFLDELSKSHKYLAQVFEKEGNIEQAYSHLASFQILNDSLVNKSNRDRLTLLQWMFEENLQMSELELLKAQNEIQAYRLSASRLYNIFFALGFAVIAGLGVRLFFLYKSFRKSNQELLLQKKKIEEQNQVLEKQSGELLTINETKNKLFSILGHDLRGPVGQVKSVIDLMLGGQLERSEFDELLEALKKDVDSVNFTLNNTLQWSMAQMEGFKIHPSHFDLRTSVEHSLSLLDSYFKEKNLTVFNQMESRAEVYADPNLVEVVIRNILNNAAKFSNFGDAVTIYSETYPDWVQLCVLDQGVGMNQEQIDSLLKDSYTLTKSRLGTQKEKGSGLGLQLVKDFVRKNNGEVSIESNLGHGTKFCIRLPRSSSTFHHESVQSQKVVKV